MVKKIVVIGGGGHAKVVISLLKKLNEYIIVGYTDPNDYGAVLSVPYLGSDSVLAGIRKKEKVILAALGIGQLTDATLRLNKSAELELLGFEFPSIISPNAVINEDVTIGKGTVVMDGVVINSGSRIGEFDIINTRSSIDHDCIIGDYVHIAPGVTLSGAVKVGSFSLLGTGAVAIQSVEIGDRCSIGAGAVVIHSCPEPGTYVGIPAQKISSL